MFRINLLIFFLCFSILICPLSIQAQRDDFPEPVTDTDGLIIPEGYKPPPDDIPLDDDYVVVEPENSNTTTRDLNPDFKSGKGRITENENDSRISEDDNDSSFGMAIDDEEKKDDPVQNERINSKPTEKSTNIIAGNNIKNESNNKTTENENPDKLFEEGTLLFNEKKYNEALKKFNRAIELDPKNDVYKLALEMVQATIKVQDDENIDFDDANQNTDTAKNNKEELLESGVLMIDDKKNNVVEPIIPVKNQIKKRISKKHKMTSLTLDFTENGSVGDLHFWKGRRCSVASNGKEYVAILKKGKRYSDMAIGFTIPGNPVKAVAIITHSAGIVSKTFFPLRISVNKNETLDGTYQLQNEFREHRFNISPYAKRGINYIRLSTDDSKANYRLKKIVIFLQYQGYKK